MLDDAQALEDLGLVVAPSSTLLSDLRSHAQLLLGPLLGHVWQLTPNGETPTGPALRRAAAALKARNYTRGVIVLVSDGEANCGEDPCKVAKELQGDGIDVVVNTIGFHAEGNAGDQLRCIAEATGGFHQDVTTAVDLPEAVHQAAQIPLRVMVDVPATIPTATGRGTGDRNACHGDGYQRR